MRAVTLVALILMISGCTQTNPKPESKADTPAYFKADPSTAASVTGTVRFEGKVPPAKRISMDAEEACQKLHKTPVTEQYVLVGKDKGLANAFVYIKTGLEGKTFEPPKDAVVLEQHGCQFIPRVVALRTRQTIRIKNSDPVSHNIHPMPQNNRDWNQQQAPDAEDLQRRFGYPEVMIPVKCNIHAWMKTYIGVLDHPYFAVTGNDGTFSFEGLPPGDYTIAAWHEIFGETTQKVSLGAKQTGTAAFTFR
jgi:hypothetical protein